MNPPGAKPIENARFSWRKGLMRVLLPAGCTERPTGPIGPTSDERQGARQQRTGLSVPQQAQSRFGRKFQSQPRHRNRTGLWVGLMAGPVLFLAHAPLCADDWSRSNRGIISDALPRYTGTIANSPADLRLQRPNEMIAEALAAYAEGVAAEENADRERALEAYKRALSLDASNTELAIKVAFELAQRDDVPQGIDILKDAAKAAPKDLLPPLGLSQLYGKFLKKPQLAERYAQTAHQLAPENIGPYLALYEIYVESKQTKKAEAILKKAASAETTDPVFWLQLAEATIRDAISGSDTQFPPEQVASVTALLKKAVAGDSDNPEVLAKTGDSYVMIRQIKEAIPLYEAVIKASKDPTTEEIIAVRDKLARCLLADERQEEGIAMLEAITQDAPNRYETYELLGEWYALQERYEQATHAYLRALKVDSSQPRYYLRIADLQFLQGRHNDAVRTVEIARKRFPRQALITYALARILTEAERYKEALVIYAAALEESHHSSEDLFSAEFHFRYGAAAERAGDLALAAEHLRRSIELDPTNAAPAYNYLGYMWADQGIHLEEALELIQNALKQIPDDPAFLDSLGWCYYRMGRYEEAVDFLKKAIDRMQPEESILYDHLGDALHALGKPEEALENWKKARDLDPKNKALAEKILKGGVLSLPTSTEKVAGETAP